MNVIEGQLSAQGCSLGIAVSRFNSVITERLLAASVNCFVRHGGEEKNITTVWCPGSFELAQAARKMLESKKYDALICLGCIVRGETPHFDYVASATSRSIAELAKESSLPVVFGVLTTETMEQAFDRAGGKQGNKGWDAAMTAIEMINLFKTLSKK